LIENILGNNWN